VSAATVSVRVAGKTRAAALAVMVSTAIVVQGAAGCGDAPAPEDPINIGLMLSFSGYLAANSINSERALLMAIDAANAAGGVGGRPLRVIARDTRSTGSKVAVPARELVEAGAAIFIGPDTTDLVTQLRTLLQNRTMILPSFATASDVEYKPASWFVMGPGIARVACEIVAQLRADGRSNPLAIVNPTGYTSSLSWELGNTYGMPKMILPTDQAATTKSVEPITSMPADAYVLAAFPTSGSSLIYALTALGALDDPTRWYLLPTLHTPAFLESIPKGVLDGVRGVSPGTIAGAAEFRVRFRERWQDQPLDDAYPFYDAAAVAVLALQRALTQEGTIPGGTGLSKHVVGVTRAGGTPIAWNQIARGLDLLQQRQEIEYVGLAGQIQFDLSGQSQAAANVNWWTITGEGFADVPHRSDCR
jgi:ABC-type branched-subunit amino acid transport system substrate-binding protein